MKSFLSALTFFISFFGFSQRNELSVSLIADSLKVNANAVIRLDQLDVEISSQSSVFFKKTRIVTVLNEKGLSAIDASEGYDKTTSVRTIEAVVYDAFGNEIKKIKRKEFRDQCLIDGISLFSDARILFLNYIPTQYPFTIVYQSEVSSSNTAFLPRWYFVSDYNTGVEKNLLNIVFPNNLGFKKKEFNFSGYNIKTIADTPVGLSYVVLNITPKKEEIYSPDIQNLFPWVMLGLEKFSLSGIEGNASSWKEFGQWYSAKILSDTYEISDETKAKMKELVGSETDAIQKAKIIFNYVQQKSRYVSIQVGIGGWKPMLAKDVDRLGYGDCKALTNYTHALLKTVDVPSYHTILYAGLRKRNIDSEFVSMQGNHMMLAIPYKDNYYWLECTSQDVPFGHQANFSDDRDVLIVKPDGAEIAHTKNYQDQDNAQISKGSCMFSEDGSFEGKIRMISQGAEYDYKSQLEHKSPEKQEEYYKELWDNLHNLQIKKTTFENDKEKVQFTENVEISSDHHATLSANKFLFSVNIYNVCSYNIKRIRNRKAAFEIQRGSYEEDEIDITLPNGFSIETLPNNVSLNSRFGQYKSEIIKKNLSQITYKRTFLLKKGKYLSSEYEDYRLFIEQIVRHDNAKIIAVKP